MRPNCLPDAKKYGRARIGCAAEVRRSRTTLSEAELARTEEQSLSTILKACPGFRRPPAGKTLPRARKELRVARCPLIPTDFNVFIRSLLPRCLHPLPPTK